MKACFISVVVVAAFFLVAIAEAQVGSSWRGSNREQSEQDVAHAQQSGASKARQREKPKPPFRLTPQQNAQVDHVLRVWEKHSSMVKTFECPFTRFEYDLVFGPQDKPKYIDQGNIKFAAPDKGYFEVLGQRPEKWVCNGKSIFEYKFNSRQVVEHQLPPEIQGKGITDGPLPFMFGARAEKLKSRYFVRIVTPKQIKNQIWLETYPKFQRDAANYSRVDVILNTRNMQPSAIQVHSPNEKNRTVYKLDDNPKINATDLFSFLKDDPFQARAPLGWTKIVEQPAVPRLSRQQSRNARN